MSIFTYTPVGTPNDAHIFWAQDALGTTDYKYTRAEIVALVASDLATEIAATNGEIIALQNEKLERDGSIAMTGPLTLPADPTNPLEASTKQYVDAALGALATLADPVFTGNPEAPTASVNTETADIATTAFVLAQLDESFHKRTLVTTSSKLLAATDSGYVGVNYAGAVTITLPTIGLLSEPQRVIYRIKDEGFNANSTTQIITINTAGGNSIENGASSWTITTPGEDVIIYNNGTTGWFISGIDTLATTTSQGIVSLATSAEAQGLTNATKVITPATLAEVINKEVYKATELGTALKTFVEDDAGTWYVTYTSTGSVTINLPTLPLTDYTKCTFEIVDIGNATVNNITINGAGANINGAGTPLVITNTYASVKLITDGTQWFTTNNTQAAIDTAVTEATAVVSSPTLANVLSSGNTTGASDLSIDSGQKLIFNNSGFTASFVEPTLTGNISYTLPATGGTLASTGSVLALAGGTMTGDITMSDTKLVKFSDGTFTGSLSKPTGLVANAVFTLPNTTGTLALQSELSAYLPLSGGLMAGVLDMDTNDIMLGSGANIYFNDGGAFDARLTTAGGVLTANRTFTFPDATGTLALTSDLGSYLALAGGSMTGNLVMSGTTDIQLQAGSQINLDGATGNTYVGEFAGDLQVATDGMVWLSSGAGTGNDAIKAGNIAGTFVNFLAGPRWTGIRNQSTPATLGTFNGHVYRITSTGTADSLAFNGSGTDGQELKVIYVAEGAAADSVVITFIVGLLGGYTSVTLNDIGDTVTFRYDSTLSKWAITDIFNAVVA